MTQNELALLQVHALAAEIHRLMAQVGGVSVFIHNDWRTNGPAIQMQFAGPVALSRLSGQVTESEPKQSSSGDYARLTAEVSGVECWAHRQIAQEVAV